MQQNICVASKVAEYAQYLTELSKLIEMQQTDNLKNRSSSKIYNLLEVMEHVTAHCKMGHVTGQAAQLVAESFIQHVIAIGKGQQRRLLGRRT